MPTKLKAVDFEHVKLNIDGKEAMTVDAGGLDEIILKRTPKMITSWSNQVYGPC